MNSKSNGKSRIKALRGWRTRCFNLSFLACLLLPAGHVWAQYYPGTYGGFYSGALAYYNGDDIYITTVQDSGTWSITADAAGTITSATVIDGIAGTFSLTGFIGFYGALVAGTPYGSPVTFDVSGTVDNNGIVEGSWDMTYEKADGSFYQGGSGDGGTGPFSGQRMAGPGSAGWQIVNLTDPSIASLIGTSFTGWEQKSGGWYFVSGGINILGPYQFPENNHPGIPLNFGDSGAAASQPRGTQKDAKSGGPVDLATGGETITHPLLNLSGARDLDFTLYYDSQLTAGNQYITPAGGAPFWTLYAPGDIGHWTHNFEGQAAYFAGSSSVSNKVILLVAHRRWTFLQNGTSFESFDQSAAYDTLVQNAGGGYTLTTKDQTRYTFSGTNLYMTQVANPHGQVINIARNTSGQITKITEPVSGEYFLCTYTNGRISGISDSAGRTVALAYDGHGMLTQVTEANGGTTSFTYDSARHLVTEADALGDILTSNTYDSTGFGYVSAQKDARGNYFDYAYSPFVVNGYSFMSVSVRDRNSNTATYVYDQNRNLVASTSPDHETNSYSYDANGNLLARTDPRHNITSYAYDSNGNAIRIIDALGKTNVMTYDSRHNLLTVINPDNDTSAFTYDADNNLLTATDGLGHQVVRTYNINSLLLTQKNPNGGVSSNTYTGGLLTSHMDVAGNTEMMTYDAVGNLATLTDPTGATTTNHYGVLRELLEVDDALGNKLANIYDWRLRKSTVIDPSGAVTSYAYDGNNNVLFVTNALHQVTAFGYDHEDRFIAVTDPLGNTSYRSYDADGRLVETTDATGDTMQYSYDGANNLLTVIDGETNVVVSNAYDARNQLTNSADALRRTSALTYDNAGLHASTTDPLGLIHSFMHDALGRTTNVFAPLSTSTSQSFDADGNRTALVNASHNSTVFTFDVADRLTKTATPTGKATTYSYNNRSLTALITLPSGTNVSYTYDALGRISNAVDPVGRITYTYDPNGRVISTVQAASGSLQTITRQYDALGRLTQFTDAAGNVLHYAYDVAGNLVTLTYPDGKTVAYGYDAAHRLTSVTDWTNRVTHYSYDADGRVARVARPDQSVETFTYDVAAETTQCTDVAGSAAVIHNILYSYDGDSEITGENTTPAPGIYHPANLTNTVDADNRLATINGKAAVYDNNGNLVSATIPGSVISDLSYDARNRLSSAGGLTYAYDAEDRRISVTSSAGTSSYIIDPNAGLDRVLVKTSPNGTVTRYVYGLGLIGEETSSAFTTYHYDHHGSTTALTDINGNVTQTFSYGPNGEPVGFNPATAPTSFLYGGRYGVASDANGLCYMRARYYLPAISRFINQDPTLGDIALGISLNRFAYANDDPIDRYDPFGLAAQPLISWQGTTTAVFTPPRISGAGTTASGFDPGLSAQSPVCGQECQNNRMDVMNSLVGVANEWKTGAAQSLQNAGEFSLYGKTYSSLFYGNQTPGYSAIVVAEAKATQGAVADLGGAIGFGSAVFGGVLAAKGASDSGFSNRGLAQAGASLWMIPIGLLYPAYGTALVLAYSIGNANGVFNGAYAYLDNTPRLTQSTTTAKSTTAASTYVTVPYNSPVPQSWLNY